MIWEVIDSIDQISAREWNRCVPSKYPFLSHEFLEALERSGCVSSKTGWLPQHIVIRNDSDHAAQVVGVAPTYIKFHSWGEYIFDWQWASGHHQFGIQYYPKLVSQSPYTPVTGSKLLVGPGANAPRIQRQIIAVTEHLLETLALSSVHWHFVPEQDQAALKAAGAIPRRSTIEYVWQNQGYTSMDDFLSTLSRRKRKKYSARTLNRLRNKVSRLQPC